MRNPSFSWFRLTVFGAAVERAGLKPTDVEEVFVGNVLSAKYVTDSANLYRLIR